ncbi:MAG: hypothetical protein CMH49_09095 [Myxococcales bacterium]|nr:hypothetical protein [Myxococcales bacterium]
MIEHAPRFYIRLGLFSLILGLLFIPYGPVNAEIYTYEQDGVIVISSEPPPRPRRRRNRRKKRSAQLKDKDSRNDLLKNGTRFERSNKLNNQAKPKRKTRQRLSKNKVKRLPMPRKLRRLKKEVEELNKKYKLPAHLLLSLFKSCHFVGKSHHKKQGSSLYRRLTCLSSEVAELIANKIQSPILNSKLMDLEHASWLIRKLINYYRGDLTLALSAYFMSAQNKLDFKSVVGMKNINKGRLMTLKSLVDASQNLSEQRSSSQRIHTTRQQSRRSRAFLQYVLGELKREK